MTEGATIHAETMVVADGGVASTELGDQLALLNLSESAYYTMNPVAAAVWGWLSAPTSAAALALRVRDQFEVGDADVEHDVSLLVADLLRLKLIRLADG